MDYHVLPEICTPDFESGLPLGIYLAKSMQVRMNQRAQVVEEGRPVG